MSSKITETEIELFCIELLEDLKYDYIYGPTIAPDSDTPERSKWDDVVLVDRLKHAVSHLNPKIPISAQEQAIRELLNISSPDLITNNEKFHRYLVDGIDVEYQMDGITRGDTIRLIDYKDPTNNEFLVVNQFTVIENNINKRPDVILFVNGLPLIMIELKNPADEKATLESAYKQIQTYKTRIPALFNYNSLIVISDGLEARAGSLSAGFNRFSAWKSKTGLNDASPLINQIEILINGIFNKSTILDLIRHFTVFEKESKKDLKTGQYVVESIKKIAAYHQYYAVNKAVKSVTHAIQKSGDRKGGVIWHTQGSGKSLSMVFFTGKLVLELDNPTVVMLTDRNDLDDQLYSTFANSRQLLRQKPVQAKSRDDLREKLTVASGGIVFTTIQKFFPEDNSAIYPLLSDRKNIIVIADEAHRSQYGFHAKEISVLDKDGKEIGKRTAYGLAKYVRDALPNATFVGFTATPIELTDRNTMSVFGDYIDIYDVAQAEADHAVVKIYYESRFAKVHMDDKGKKLVEELEERLETEEFTQAQKAKAKWTKLEAIVGSEPRLRNVAKDALQHFEERQQTFHNGKAMFVTMSRRIAVAIYDEIIKLKPHWANPDINKGSCKVIITTSSSDGPEMDLHHTNKDQRRDISNRFKDPEDPLKFIIVCDMWLTGFDVPCLNTMYFDKPMKGHSLMQAIARVNRLYIDKPGGLIVDYIGIAADLKKAMAIYVTSGGKGNPVNYQEQAVDLMLEKFEIVEQFFHEFDYKRYFQSGTSEKLSIILEAEEHILGLEDGKKRYIREVTVLSKSFALAVPHEKSLEIKETVAFFQTVKARLVKFTGGGGEPGGIDINTAIRQVIDQAITSDQVVDIFAAAGMEKPEFSILSKEFLEEVRNMKRRNLAIELLKKLLQDEIHAHLKKNVVQSKRLLEMLNEAITKYENRQLTAMEVIEELIRLAKQIKEEQARAKESGLSDDEIAFYDALANNKSAVEVLGDEKLKELAMVLVERVRKNSSIDWSIKENVRARMRVTVKRLLRKYNYPPDKQAIATETVLKQAELFTEDWINKNKK